MNSFDRNSFCGPMVRIPPFQGGGSCSIHGSCMGKIFSFFWVFCLHLKRGDTFLPNICRKRGKRGAERKIGVPERIVWPFESVLKLV